MVFERCAFLPQERSVRSNFHIPKMIAEPSRSLLDVTSSTQHDNEQQHYQENETRRSSSGCYSNYRHDAPEARCHGSPLRFEIAHNPNRSEMAASAIDSSSSVVTRLPVRRCSR
ncbi:uncharacterized protein LOC119770371 isoform X1 [Culex quinquefasciatus]|uniref:uncharacterized protein LOC119770371 isoform X1 n=1 Tax=Culex quinquefasciatus TaxID=7176 RepID=UPI0018E3D7A9|nr:uncharacterized protein LOC119770371 isoform X1 [Culex quinquefasciatus]